MGFFSSLFNAPAELEVHDDITAAMKAAGIYSRNAYDKSRKYALGFVYMYESQLKEQGIKLTNRNRGEYADVVRTAATNNTFDAGYLGRGESEEFGDAIARFFNGNHETMSVIEMHVIYRAASLMEQSKPTAKNGKVKVKFRRSHVDVSGFEHFESEDDELPEAWYDAQEEYLLLHLEDTVYHYTRVPVEVWEGLKADEDPYGYYSMEIEGNYDARDGAVPSYK